MQCPTCKAGVLRQIKAELICNRFPVCRHQEKSAVVRQQSHLPYVIFDVETTGLGNSDKIIEIGAVKVVNGNVIDEFEALINPGFYISMHITKITGITNKDLMGKPTEDEVIPKFMDWVGDVEMIGAHNLPFDARHLRNACNRLNLPHFEGKGFCTLSMSRKALSIKSLKLGIVCDHFGIPLTNAHRAIYDVRATKSLFDVLVENYPNSLEIKPFKEFGKKS